MLSTAASPSAGACACVRRLRAPFFVDFFFSLFYGTDFFVFVHPACSFHPEQALVLASGGYDTTVRLWNVETLKETRTFYGHTGSVTSLAYSAQVCSHMPTHTPRMRLHGTHTHLHTNTLRLTFVATLAGVVAYWLCASVMFCSCTHCFVFIACAREKVAIEGEGEIDRAIEL